MKVIILAAGFARRLLPITQDKPKALLEISGKYVLDYLITKIKEISETSEIIIITNNLFYSQFSEWAEGKNIKVVNDSINSWNERLGAIGDLFFAIQKEKIDEDIAVFSSDIIFNFSLKEPFKIFNECDKDLAVFYDIHNKEDIKRFGDTVIKNNLIFYFKEKPESPISTITDASIFFFKKKTIPLIKQFILEGTDKDAPGRFLEYLYQKVPVYAYLAEGNFLDIGSKEYLDKAKKLNWN